MPVFPTENGDIGRYIAEKYEDKTKVGMQLSIKLKFVINKKGKLIGARIVNKKESEYTEEENMIIDIIKSSPKWEPGTCSNIKTNILLQMRLKFVVDERGRLRQSGQFVINGDGGTVTFSNKDANIDGMTLSEELFDAYQHDNKANYASGEFNVKFEAKLASTMIASDAGQMYADFQGMSPFQNNVGMDDYGKRLEAITSGNVVSSGFINEYKSAANAYGKYNKSNNIGNSHYHKSTTVAPYSLQQMVIKAYGK